MEHRATLRFAGSYGHREALGTVDLTWEQVRSYALLGPNGSGKSTMLATLAGHLDPLAGTVTVDGVDVRTKEALEKVHLIDSPVFLPDLTVMEHLQLKHGDDQDFLSYLVATWNLEDLAEAYPAWLSSGQRQRTHLAIHLETPADFILVDEPERHLDTAWTALVAEQLTELTTQPVGVIVATHSPVIARACDVVVELS